MKQSSNRNGLFNSLQAKQAKKRKLQQAGEGLFVGEGMTKKGEPFYLKMELITSENVEQWHRYYTLSQQFIEYTNSGFRQLVNNIQATTDSDGNKTYDFIPGRRCQVTVNHPSKDYSSEEFSYLVNYLGSNGYIAGSDKTMTYNAHSGGFYTTAVVVGTYMVYAAKKDDFTMSSCPKDNKSRTSIKCYIEDYQDLLMTVTSNLDSSRNECNVNGFKQVGISRNPWSIIQGDYKGIAMDLHSFTGAVVDKYFKDKQEMLIYNPLDSMKQILIDQLGENLMEADFGSIKIQVSSLAQFYYDANKRMCPVSLSRPS